MQRLAVLIVLVAQAGCASGQLGRRASIIYNAVTAEVAPDNAIVEIDRAFIERYKNRVTISTNFTVDAVPKSPNPRLFDGDLHIAGRAPEIGLRLVAEIKNADAESAAVALASRAARARSPLPFTGVWRLWPEHAIGPEQQGDSVPQLKTPNPDHVFEIHPLIRIGEHDLLKSFHPVEGYRPGSAAKTFGVYDDAECTQPDTAPKRTTEPSKGTKADSPDKLPHPLGLRSRRPSCPLRPVVKVKNASERINQKRQCEEGHS